MLENLKIDLGITTDRYDARLNSYLQSAQSMIATEGITLDTTDTQDQQIIIMYASWLWRRRDTMEGMPRMLRWLMNNRLMHEKMETE